MRARECSKTGLDPSTQAVVRDPQDSHCSLPVSPGIQLRYTMGEPLHQFPGRGRQLRNRFRALGCASCPISEDLGGCHFRLYSSPPQLLCKGCSGSRWRRGRFVNLHTGPCQPPNPPSPPKLGPKGLPLAATPQGQATSPCSLAHEGNRDCCVDTGRPQTTGESSSWTKESEKGLTL